MKIITLDKVYSNSWRGVIYSIWCRNKQTKMTKKSDASADLYVKDYAGGFVHVFLVKKVERNAILNEISGFH